MVGSPVGDKDFINIVAGILRIDILALYLFVLNTFKLRTQNAG